MKKRFCWFDIIIILFNAILYGIIAAFVCYGAGYRDGQIDAIEGEIRYEISIDTTYKEKL